MTEEPLEAGRIPDRPTQPWEWICEFCYRLLYVNTLPADWEWIFQSAVCPDCQLRVMADGGYHVVPGGTYATTPDPRSTFTVHAHIVA